MSARRWRRRLVPCKTERRPERFGGQHLADTESSKGRRPACRSSVRAEIEIEQTGRWRDKPRRNGKNFATRDRRSDSNRIGKAMAATRCRRSRKPRRILGKFAGCFAPCGRLWHGSAISKLNL